MFTGIVEELGTVKQVVSGSAWGQIEIAGREVLEGTKLGDSIAVNGVCLTVTNLRSGSFTADVMAETMRRSNLGSLKKGDQVNLERAMAADGRLGGHLVSGHIAGTGVISQMKQEGNAVWVTVDTSEELMRLIVEKGSIAIDGISLTVAKEMPGAFQVSIIPHTGEETTLLKKKPGAVVNLENDMIGKYVEKLMRKESEGGGSSLTLDFLKQHGF